jgi:hypothetical protein
MTNRKQQVRECQICHRTVPESEAVSGETIRPVVIDEIVRDYPEWSNEGWICRNDLHRYRARRVRPYSNPSVAS